MPMNKDEFEKLISDTQTNCTKEELDLHEKLLEDNQVIQLAKVLEINTSIKKLHLAFNCSRNNTVALALAEVLKNNTALQELSLHSNDPAELAVQLLVRALEMNATLQQLYVHFPVMAGSFVGELLEDYHDSRLTRPLYDLMTPKAQEERKTQLQRGQTIIGPVLENVTTMAGDVCQVIADYSSNHDNLITWGRDTLNAARAVNNSATTSKVKSVGCVLL